MNTYLTFLMNAVTQEEFVAPVTAPSRDAAIKRAYDRYPPSAYTVITCYEDAEMRRILDDVARWPGVASSVQPPLEQLLKKERPHATASTNTKDAMQRLAQTITQGKQEATWKATAASMGHTAPSHTIASPSTPAAQPTTPSAPPAQAPVADLKSALALLRATGASGGHVTQHQENPVKTQDIRPTTRKAPSAESTASASTKTADMETLAAASTPSRSVIDLFKSMRSAPPSSS